MDNITSDVLNQSAMQIIMLAGDARNLMTEALNNTLDGVLEDEIEDKLKEAKEKLTKAHHIQTDMIQSSIDDDDLKTTLLFSHAQDTLMTIYSEQNMILHLIKMYNTLKK